MGKRAGKRYHEGKHQDANVHWVPGRLTMTYALIKLIHLLALIVWVGGLLFSQCFLGPALRSLPAGHAALFMQRVLRRFFAAVAPAAALVLLSGLWMIGRTATTARRAGQVFEMPWSWTFMAVLGLVMVLVFAYLWIGAYRRLARSLARRDWDRAASALVHIRHWMAFNLFLGVLVIAIVSLA